MDEDKNTDKSVDREDRPDVTTADKNSSKRGLLLLIMLVLVIAVVAFLTVGFIRSLRGDGADGKSSKETKKALKEIKKVGTLEVKLPGGGVMTMIEVKAPVPKPGEAVGSFEMSRKDDANWSDEKPHNVEFKNDFYIGKTEVTQAQWKAVMGVRKNGDEAGKEKNSHFRGDDRPVERVSWNEALAFCEKLNSLKLAPEGYKFTLPTEAQWEYAAAGGVEKRNCKYSGSDELDEIGWYGDSGKGKGKDKDKNVAQIKGETHPVAGKKPNELGIYDMSGNVWEWTIDDYSGDSSKTKAEERLVISDSSKGQTIFCQYRSVRGGSWSKGARYCRVAARSYYSTNSRYNFLGFRVALVKVKK